jgi:ElaB/YqjD/DUF883 family membrane-anchored ribosome-binding protein
MSRLKKNQNTDRLINVVNIVLKNRCSLSDEDFNLLTEIDSRLQEMKFKKGKTNKDVAESSIAVVELLVKYFKE